MRGMKRRSVEPPQNARLGACRSDKGHQERRSERERERERERDNIGEVFFFIIIVIIVAVIASPSTSTPPPSHHHRYHHHNPPHRCRRRGHGDCPFRHHHSQKIADYTRLYYTLKANLTSVSGSASQLKGIKVAVWEREIPHLRLVTQVVAGLRKVRRRISPVWLCIHNCLSMLYAPRHLREPN